MRMLGWLCARTSRCFIRQPCSTTGPACASLFAAWASYEAALLWGSVLEIQHVPPVPADVLDALPPGIPPIRVVPCVDMGCARCREGRGGYQFPFLGTFSRRSVLVAPGTSPSDAWEQHHANGVRYRGERAPQQIAADRPTGPARAAPTSPSGRYPEPALEALARMAPGRATAEGTGVVHTSAFSGSGRASEVSCVHRALWLLLGGFRGGHGNSTRSLCLVWLPFCLVLPQM